MVLQNDDMTHMRHALRLAARGLGRVAPNPAVGCIIVSNNNRIVGRGWTAPGGRPHAETLALAQAGEAARGATAYVTLEPCAHHGQTPPCADALVAAGIARVVAAVADPDPRVDGSGFAKLTGAGIPVTTNICEAEARAVNAGFFKRVQQGRPLVALKTAQSADGYVAGAKGTIEWITSEPARRHGHFLRAQHDAILVGIGTVLADDPMLTCRLPGLEDRSPLRVVLDSHLRLSPGSQLARSARDVPVIVFTTAPDGGDDLAALGIEIERVAADATRRPGPLAVLHALARRGVTRLLIEGGPTVQAAFMKAKLADRMHIYQAPLLIGQGGKPGVAPSLSSGLATAPHLEVVERRTLGPDTYYNCTIAS